MDITAYDLFILILRAAFIFLLYFFLFLVVRVIAREINSANRRATLATRGVYPYPVSSQNDYSNPATPGRLVVTDAGNASTVRQGMVFLLKPVTPIGRRPDNLVVLNDDFVSNEHTLIAFREDQWWVSDIASKNGTYLNGEKLKQPLPLKIGDLIGIGNVKLRLEG